MKVLLTSLALTLVGSGCASYETTETDTVRTQEIMTEPAGAENESWAVEARDALQRPYGRSKEAPLLPPP